MKKLKTLEKEYLDFLKKEEYFLNIIRKILGKESLDFSLYEISQIENVYNQIIDDSSYIEISIEEFEKSLTMYIGTAFIYYFGGNWTLNKLKNTETYGEFEIENWGGPNNKNWNYINPKSWLWFIKTKQMDESIASIFERKISLFKNNHRPN